MRFILLFACMLVFGCSSESEDEESSILYDSAKAPLDKAESVEDTVLESAERLEDAIEESED
ncbi:MAG: hypothetical protein ACR2QX_01760 [Woeseiaceae bacterium]